MKLKEYKENIVLGYENRKEGLLMYKHQKLFDISNFIKQVVDIGIEGKLTTDEYMNEVEKLFQKMPEEFKEQYKDKYDEFILAHEKTKNDIAYHTREISKKEKIADVFKSIFFNKNFFSDKRAFLRDNDAVKLRNNDIDVTQHGVVTVVSLPEGYLYKNYENVSGFVDLKKPGKIYIKKGRTKATINHEYIHTLHHSGLLAEYKDFIMYGKNKTTKDLSVLNLLLKDEFLAFISNGIEDHMKKFGLGKDLIIPILFRYLGQYIKKLGIDKNIVVDKTHRKIDKKTGETNYSINAYQKNNRKIKPLSEKTRNLVLEKVEFINYMYQTYEEIYKICVPKYYPHKDQFHYMLAFTPLSQWEEVLRTYQKIEKIEKTKSDIADTFSSEKDKSQ